MRWRKVSRSRERWVLVDVSMVDGRGGQGDHFSSNILADLF